MKKTYIIPETTVVALNVYDNMLATSDVKVGEDYSGLKIQSREVVRQDIKSPDAWEEW